METIWDQIRQPDELIVCDDFSDDLTIKILEEFKASVIFPVDIIRNESNQGTAYSFHKAIHHCKSDIIVFCDQDDEWLVDKLKRFEDIFAKDPTVSFIISNASIIDENSESLGYTLWDQRKFTPKWLQKFDGPDQIEIFLKRNVSTGMATAIKSSLREFYNENAIHLNHDALYIPLAFILNIKGALIDYPLTRYRQHSSQQYGAARLSGFRKIKYIRELKYTSLEKQCAILTGQLNLVKEIKGPLLTTNISLLEHKLNHSNFRLRLKETSLSQKIIMIFAELFKGRYLKFGTISNFFVDLFT